MASDRGATGEGERVLRAFVAGASGYTGRAVVTALLRRGVETHAHIRPGSSSLTTLAPRFEAQGATVDSTPWAPAALSRSLERIEPSHCFALLGTTRKRARSEGLEAAEAYDRVDYGLTAMLLEALGRAGQRPRFVYLSSLGTGPDTGNAYLEARWRVEEELRASGLSHVIARPSFVTGSDRQETRPLERLAATASDFALGLAGALGGERLRDRYRSIDAERLAAVLVTLGLDRTDDGVVDSAAIQRLARA